MNSKDIKSIYESAEFDLLRNKLIHAVTSFDQRNAKKQGYNHYALAQYIAAVTETLKAIKEGEIIRRAFLQRFEGKLLDIVLKAAGQSPATKEERLG